MLNVFAKKSEEERNIKTSDGRMMPWEDFEGDERKTYWQRKKEKKIRERCEKAGMGIESVPRDWELFPHKSR